MKLFNYIIILIFICNYIFIHLGIKSLIFILALLLCLLFILFFWIRLRILNFRLFFNKNLETLKYNHIGYDVLIIVKKVINLISLLTLFFSFSPNWMLYIDYVVEAGLEDSEDVNKAVDELGLTDNQKYYLKIGCIITAAVLSVIFGYYIIKNYEIFKPVDNDLKDFKSFNDDLSVDDIEVFKDNTNQENPINDDALLDSIIDETLHEVFNQENPINNDLPDDLNSYVKKIFENMHEHLLLNNLDSKEYDASIKVQKIWESLTQFRATYPDAAKFSLIEEITSENIQYYETFNYHYNVYLEYVSNATNPVITDYYRTLVNNMVDAFFQIPEIAEKVKKNDFESESE